MSLIQSALKDSLKQVMNAGLLLTTAEAAATSYASAYNSYASLAQHPGGLPPTVVNYVGCLDDLKDAFSQPQENSTDAAELWGSALVKYWTGAKFGATGEVVIPGIKQIAITGLVSVWTTLGLVYSNLILVSGLSAEAAKDQAIDQAADGIAAALHAFTISVTALDTALPPPSGSPPTPLI